MKKIVAGNWKLHKTRNECVEFIEEARDEILNETQARWIVAPSAPLLESACRISEGSKLEIFAQNCGPAVEGAYTGESSVAQLCDLGVSGVIVGHSERRHVFLENEESVFERAMRALEADLSVIFCIGEKLDERKNGEMESVLSRQLAKLLIHCGGNKFPHRITLAYEPVWAIGTGERASAEQVAESHQYLAQLLKDADLSAQILYGGSVKANNIGDLSPIPNLDGVLVGGASLEWKSLKAIGEGLTA